VIVDPSRQTIENSETPIAGGRNSEGMQRSGFERQL
jgi:hypothetical protein